MELTNWLSLTLAVINLLLVLHIQLRKESREDARESENRLLRRLEHSEDRLRACESGRSVVTTELAEAKGRILALERIMSLRLTGKGTQHRE